MKMPPKNENSPGKVAASIRLSREEMEEEFRIVFSALLFNESGPCHLCREILRGFEEQIRISLFELYRSSAWNSLKKVGSNDDPVFDFNKKLSQMTEGIILHEDCPDACLEVNDGSDLILCFRELWDSEKIRNFYNERKSCKSGLQRGKPGTYLPCLLNLQKTDGTVDTSLVNKLKHIWTKLSKEFFNLQRAKNRDGLLKSILSIYSIRTVLIKERIGEKCIRLNKPIMQMELMRLPSISEEGDEDFTACKAHYSLWVYTMCNYLRLSLLGQKSNPDVVVLGENNEENKALIGRGWWNEQYKIKQPICPKFGEIVQTIFLYNSMSEAENNQFSRRVLGTLLRIDSTRQIQQIQLLGLTRFQCHSREFKILYGIEQNIADMAIYMAPRGYYFVPASRIVQLTPEEERKLEMISFRSIYLTVIYDSSKNKKIHSMVKKKLKNFKIDRYFWYFPTSEFSGHTGVELSSFGRLFSKENQWISDALNSFLSEIYFAKLVESGTGLRDAGNWRATLQKKLEAIHGKENFYSADQSRWKIEVFDTAKMNLVGWQSFLVTNPRDYRLMIETSFSRLGEFLAKVFKGKVEDLPEHFLHPMKALRGERIPGKWYKLPSVDTCQNVQFSNCAAYVVLSLSIERYFKSEGKSIDTEDDILYAKRAIMLRLSRLYKKKEKCVQKEHRKSSGYISQTPIPKEIILLNFNREWKKAMFNPIKVQTGKQRRRKTKSGVDDNAIGQEKINSGTDGKKQS